jgi:small-conductance mechanosensitive channel
MAAKRTLAALIWAPSVIWLLACGSGEGEPEARTRALDTLQAPTALAPDTVSGEEAEAEPGPSSPDSGDSVPQDTFPTAAIPDTTAPSLDDLSQRVRTLEEENDSLRIALRTLIQAGSSGAAVDRPTETGASEQEDILQVDRDQVRNWGLRTLVAVLLVGLTALVIRILAWVLEKLSERSAARRLMFKRLVPILRILIWAFAAFFIVRVVFSVGGQELLAAGAAVGVAVGFAAQDILKNIFGGLIVLFDQPFQVGDKVSVGGTYGEVVAIGLRSTRIVTPDDNLVTVPNAQVVDGQVANANAGELNCQVVTDLYLPGWVDEAKAKKIAFDAAASSKYVYLNKPIVVLVKDKFEDTFLTHLKVKAYVLDPRYEFLFMSDVTERARMGFRKAGLLGPMHGVRAYVDLDRFPELQPSESPQGEETGKE